MSAKTRIITGLALVGLWLAWAAQAATADDAVAKALAALKTYDWGSDRAVLAPIDAAAVASHNDAAAQKALEGKLAAVLATDVSQAAKDYVCRKLSLIGSAACVPAVTPLLADEKLSHMARYALERIPDEAAVAAMRGAVPKLSGPQKVGTINSLGVRRDAASTAMLVGLLGDSNAEVASAAAAALGAIGTSEAAKALGPFQAKAPKSQKLAAADAYLTCAEHLLADGKKTEAMMIYKTLGKSEFKHVKLAAVRGLLAAAGKKK